jgi:hypothetical protein
MLVGGVSSGWRTPVTHQVQRGWPSVIPTGDVRRSGPPDGRHPRRGEPGTAGRGVVRPQDPRPAVELDGPGGRGYAAGDGRVLVVIACRDRSGRRWSTKFG